MFSWSGIKLDSFVSVQTPLRQFKGIPVEALNRIEKKDLAWERYYDLSAQELGELIRVPKLGRSLHKYVHQFPRLELAAQVQPITRTVLKVTQLYLSTPLLRYPKKSYAFAQCFISCECMMSRYKIVSCICIKYHIYLATAVERSEEI